MLSLSTKKVYHRKYVLSFNSYADAGTLASRNIGWIIKSITSSFNSDFDLKQVGNSLIYYDLKTIVLFILAERFPV